MTVYTGASAGYPGYREQIEATPPFASSALTSTSIARALAARSLTDTQARNVFNSANTLIDGMRIIGLAVDGNSAYPVPVNKSIPFVTGTMQEGNSLAASTGVWSNLPTSYTYQWFRNGAAISGSINSARTLTTADVGAVMSCAVTAINAGGKSISVNSANTVAIIAAASPVPVNTVLPVMSGNNTVGSTLTTTTGSWSNNPTSYTYAWRADGVDIPNATANTYTVVNGDAGKAITCRVFAKNDGGTAGATSNALTIAIPLQNLLRKYPNFPSTTRQIRQDSDIVSRSSGNYPVAFVPSTDFPDGRKVLSMIVSGSNVYNQAAIRGTFAAPVDMSNGNLALWLKRMNAGTCQVEIDLYSAGSPTSVPANYVTLNMYTGFLNFTLDASQADGTGSVFGKVGNRTSRFAVVGTGANLAAITHYQIRLGDKSGAWFNVQISDLVFTPNPRTKAAIILRMDDAWKDVYTGLKPMWEAKGISYMPFLLSPGAVASTSGIDGPTANNRLISAQVNEMRPKGWQVGTQAWTTEGSQANYAAYMTEYNGMMRYYYDRGWIDDAADGTYYSNVNMATPNARAAMIEAGSRTCQRFVNGSQTTPSFARNETFPPVDQMQIMAMNLNGFSPNLNASPARSITSQLMAQVDRVVAENGLLIIAGHQDMFQNAPEYEALQALIDRFINIGDFEFHTPNSLFNPWLTQYGPAPVYAAAYSGKA